MKQVWPIDDVLARTDLANLLDALAEPAMFDTRGRRWHCPMPDHDDYHASVTIHTDHRGHQRWRCWSGDSNHRGDAIDLVEITQHLGHTDALDWLATRSGMIPEQPLPPTLKREPVMRATADLPLDPCVIRYVEACEKILWGPTGRPVLDWLHNRGFNDALLKANRVGCDPGRQMMHRQHGLAHGSSIGAVFPALNEQGDIHYVQTRYLTPGTGPKYDNPAASLAKNPRLAWARPVEKAVGPLVVCEGIPDALTAASLGMASVAVLGSQSASSETVSSISRSALSLDRSITLINDYDAAGRTWADQLSHQLRAAGNRVVVLQPAQVGADLNDWIRADGAVEIRKALGYEVAVGLDAR